jgi:hypothetical protein
MVKVLFPGFLSDPKEYALAEAIWRDRWLDLVRRVGQEWLWQTPWLNTNFADGTPSRDGNPIFSAVSLPRRLGVRVIQVEPAHNPRELSVWTDTFAKGEAGSIKELVITCVLTGQTLLDVVDLMKRWITEEKAGLSRMSEYLGVAPITRSAHPKLLELTVA